MLRTGIPNMEQSMTVEINADDVSRAFNAAINKAAEVSNENECLYRLMATILAALPDTSFVESKVKEYGRAETRASWSHPHKKIHDALSAFGLYYHRDRHNKLAKAIGLATDTDTTP